MHCDTISLILEERRAGKEVYLRENTFQLDLMKMRKAGYLLQNFACFVNLGKQKKAYEEGKILIELYRQELEKNSDILAPVLSYADIEKNQKAGKMSALLSMEEGEICEGSTEKLTYFYEQGLRMMSLTWNFENSLAFPQKKVEDAEGKILHILPETERGLKEKGFIFVEKMEELGIIIDVSHLGDAGVKDVLRCSKRPFVASHSNARALCSHPRNLSDDLIREMAERGCVTGLNFYAAFLRDFKEGEKTQSCLEDCVRQVLYLFRKGGEDFVGLGSDYDGIEDNLEWEHAGNMERLADALQKAGLHERQLDKFASGNVLRLYKEVLR